MCMSTELSNGPFAGVCGNAQGKWAFVGGSTPGVVEFI